MTRSLTGRTVKPGHFDMWRRKIDHHHTLKETEMRKPLILLVIAAVAAVAYVIGAKAGRARYREISSTAKHLWNDPTLQKVRAESRKAIEKAAKKAAKKIGS